MVINLQFQDNISVECGKKHSSYQKYSFSSQFLPTSSTKRTTITQNSLRERANTID
jgi:hypothetical protein